jgi:UDP-N-acetylmuramoyl-tripeptide--D-alanyl-D-alanine ligase
MATAIPPNDARLDAWTAAAATGGRVAHLGHPGHGSDEATVATGIVSDTRAVRPGSAFVALRGARFDGHAFLGAAVEAGATLILCERGHAAREAKLAGVDVVEVDDTLVAWGDLARAHLRGFRRAGGRVLCLTGSAGKTTTKELAAALLGTVYPGASVHATFGNLNNRIGAPAVAFGASAATRFCVIEAGMSEPGEIERIGSFTEPDVALVLNATLAHAGGVGGTRADVAREKGALFAALAPAGVAVANADDAAVMGQLARTRAARAVTFGTHADARYRLVDRTARPGGKLGSEVSFLTPSGACSVELSIPGRAAAIDLVAAWAAAEALSGRAVDVIAAQAALDALEPPDGRMRVVRLPSGALLFDDSYNANPASVANALHALHEVATRENRRSIVVLGEMRELGESSAREHARVGELVADAAVSLLVGVGASAGGETSHALASARARGIETLAAADADEAAALVVPRVRAGDLVLVKGSRGAATDRVVCALEVAS